MTFFSNLWLHILGEISNDPSYRSSYYVHGKVIDLFKLLRASEDLRITAYLIL